MNSAAETWIIISYSLSRVSKLFTQDKCLVGVGM